MFKCQLRIQVVAVSNSEVCTAGESSPSLSLLLCCTAPHSAGYTSNVTNIACAVGQTKWMRTHCAEKWIQQIPYMAMYSCAVMHNANIDCAPVSMN